VVAGQIGINIGAVPSDGGSAITALEYRVGAGAAVVMSGLATGLRVVTAGFAAGVAADVQVRAVNAVGAGAWSDIKTRTPLAGASAPSALTAEQWTAAATATAGQISFDLTALPSDGGSAITALEYRVSAGAAIAFAGTGTGVRVVTAGLTAGVAVDLQVRAVNAVGAGAWSDVKNRTPLAGGGGGDVTFVAAATPYSTISSLAAHALAVPAGLAIGDLLVVIIGDHIAASSVVTSTSQNLTQAVRQVGAIWWVQITGSVPTSVTVNFGTASDLEAQAIAYRGPTAVAGIVNDEVFAARPTIPYTTDAANAAVVMLYMRGHPNEATAAQFNGADAADYLRKINFSAVGIATGIHDGPTGSNDIDMTWSAADGGGRYINVAFKP
jgi:hypothetical protein